MARTASFTDDLIFVLDVAELTARRKGPRERHVLGLGVPQTPASFPGLDGVTLQAYEDRAHGFMTVTAGPTSAQVVYSSVSAREQRSFDSFRIAPASPI